MYISSKLAALPVTKDDIYLPDFSDARLHGPVKTIEVTEQMRALDTLQRSEREARNKPTWSLK